MAQRIHGVAQAHDIGKPAAAAAGGWQIGKNEGQHEITVKIVPALAEHLGWPAVEQALIMQLIDGDVMGSFVRERVSHEKTVDELLRRTENVNRAAGNEQVRIQPSFFADLFTYYYQSDVMAYTSEVGGLPSLEHLFTPDYDLRNPDKIFKFDHERNRAVFNPALEKRYRALMDEIRQHDDRAR